MHQGGTRIEGSKMKGKRLPVKIAMELRVQLFLIIQKKCPCFFLTCCIKYYKQIVLPVPVILTTSGQNWEQV